MRNKIIFGKNNLKESQEERLLEVLSSAPISIIGRGGDVNEDVRAFPHLKVTSDSGRIMSYGACLTPLGNYNSYEFFPVLEKKVSKGRKADYCNAILSLDPECEIHCFSTFDNPGLRIRVSGKGNVREWSKSYYIHLGIPKEKFFKFCSDTESDSLKD